MAYAHLDDAIALAEQPRVRGGRASARNAARGAEDPRARHREARRAVKPPFPRLHYDDAIKLIQAEGLRRRSGERLRRHRRDRHRGIVRPAGGRAPLPVGDQGVLHGARPGPAGALAPADVLAPEGYGEIVGGGERLADGELLLKRIHEHGLPEESFRWYLDLRKYGTVPHSGFGMGIERVVTWICGIEHLRETIAFPRMLYRIYP